MKILVGYDGSKASREAFDIALKHAKALDIRVAVVTSMAEKKNVTPEEIEKVEEELERLKRLAADAGVACESTLLVRGISPGEDLVRFAGENPVEEIVIGIRRRSKVGKIVFGSTAQYIILKAPCPVVSVK